MKYKVFLALLCATIFLATPLSYHAEAATFTPNRIMDNGIFYDTGAMNINAINQFLNTFPGSCISTSSGFSAPDPTGYNPTNGYLYGQDVSAGQVIYDAAVAYGLNPQVLLATLEKEEGLVDGTGTYGCSALAISAAVGYGCPDGGTLYNYSGVDLYSTGTTFDSNYKVVKSGTQVTSISGTCVNSSLKAGFSQQLIHAAWLLRFGQERSEGNMNWDVQLTNAPQPGDSWDNSDDPQSCYGGPMTQGTWQVCPSGATTYYDGYTTIDGSSTHMDTGATAALYWYTPHFSGNQNFFNIFTNWFGSTYTPDYSWQLLSQYAYTDNTKTTQLGLNNLLPGQRAYVGFTVMNIGNRTWYNSGTNPVDVGTLRPTDRVSPFYDSTWLGYGRPARMKEASVAPGQTATFEFWITAPTSSTTDYKEYFGLVSEGTAWFPDIGLYYSIHVQSPAYTWQLLNQYAYTDATKTTAIGLNNLEPGTRRYVGLTIKNTGNLTWTNSGPYPVDLGATNPMDRVSPFYDSTWLGYGRPARMKEASVAPGQTATFEFWITAPLNKYGSFLEYFDPVMEGRAWFNSIGLNYSLSVINPQYSWQLLSQYAYTDSTKTTEIGLNSMSPGQTAYIGFTAKNTGNITWYNNGYFPIDVGTTNPYDRLSAFCSGGLGWLGCNRPARMKEASVAPGQTATFEFTIQAPQTLGTYREYFNPVAEGRTWLPYIGFNYLITVN